MIRRLLPLLVIVLGIALYLPDSRALIGGWVQPTLEPGRRWMTRQELRQIAADLDVYVGQRGNAPLRRAEFKSWLDQRYPQARTRVDAWDTPYRGEVTRSSVRAISAGPDGEFETSDDLMWEEARN